ncbi:hypothetical protein CEXT_57941, partial [Caerostris extrusa]
MGFCELVGFLPGGAHAAARDVTSRTALTSSQATARLSSPHDLPRETALEIIYYRKD